MSARVAVSAEALNELAARAVRAEQRANALRRHLEEIGKLSDDELRAYVNVAIALDNAKLPAPAAVEALALPAAAE